MKTTIKSRTHSNVEVTDEVLKRAILRGKSRDGDLHAVRLQFVSKPSRAMHISFADKSGVVLPISLYPQLARLKTEQLERMSLGMAGSAVCLDEEDLHVSIAGMVAASQQMSMMVKQVSAALQGSVRSDAKAAAARANGAKGGRPKKQHPKEPEYA